MKVAKHQQRLYDSKFSKSVKVLKRRVPEVHARTRDYALDYADLDVEHAERLLRMFLETEPSKTRDEEGRKHKEKQKQKESTHKRRRGERDRERDGGKDGSKKRHKHRRRHREKAEGSSRKDDDKAPLAYGNFGILKEADLHGDKRMEFIMWTKEVKKVEVETLAKWEEKKLFGEFMDLYNTATLESEKYYDLDAWHYKQAREKASTGVEPEEKTVFNDEEERKREMIKERNSMKNKKIEAAKRDLLAGKLTMMREQERLRAEQQIAYRTGNHKKARDIAELLRPSEDGKVEWDVKTGQYRKKSNLNR